MTTPRVPIDGTVVRYERGHWIVRVPEGEVHIYGTAPGTGGWAPGMTVQVAFEPVALDNTLAHWRPASSARFMESDE